jgi:hypothetical protein
MPASLHRVRHSPLLLVLIIGLGILFILVARGLNFGPLHTDIEVQIVWAKAYGFRGFIEKYLEFNQRHLLAGPRNALGYKLFGHNMFPFNFLIALSRVLEGAFLAGIIFQVFDRKSLAIGAGLALMVSPVRLAEFYQSMYWGIETTLVMLLASSYFYVLSLKAEWSHAKWRLYALSFGLYAVSTLSYEAGIPWVGVNILLGWYVLANVPWRKRIVTLGREAIPFVILGIILVILVLFVFEPWDGLTPGKTDALPIRAIKLMGSIVTFPVLYLNRLRVSVHDGYLGLVVILGLLGGGLSVGLARWQSDSEGDDQTFWMDFGKLVLLGIVMVFCAILVGTGNAETRHNYQDRMTFARSAGIALLYVTFTFGGVYAVRKVLGRWVDQWQSAAMLLTGVGLFGAGLAYMLAYQSVAQASYHEIDDVAGAISDVRCLFTRPLHMVLVTDPDWPVARIPDASDLIIRQAQAKLIEANADVTIDIVRTNSKDYEDDYKLPDKTTCEMNSPSGMCLAGDWVRASRWALGGLSIGEWGNRFVPDEDIAVVHYANDGTLTLMPQLDITTLKDYNITTIGPTILKTSTARLALPFDQMPIPLSGHCPGG